MTGEDQDEGRQVIGESGPTMSTDFETEVLKPAVHQVAGHGSKSSGRQGPVVDESGRRFFKPLHEGDERADREIAFYDKIKHDDRIPAEVKAFFPAFYGTKFLPSVDGQGLVRHGVMENLTYGFKMPSVTDVKIGYRTWYPEATEAYIQKAKKKDKMTTSGAIGIRISGLQVYEASTGSVWKPDRDWCRDMSAEMVRPTLERFVSSNPSLETFDAAFAAAVYGGPHGVLAKLRQLEEWFSTQTAYHFTSSSVLIIYESPSTTAGDGAADDQINVSVKLVDFAHTVDSNTVDDNFLTGLKALMSILSTILEEHVARRSRMS
ncbi:inositol-polyphosphate multikinase [Marchantia polymorpha subsp. ruderalis]